ncbi:MAG: InlB B-repeat-containing protein [Oscillospiraceae bacterium]|nr:InlB B-repeat-containing protein [Oscillospiraceae bacterium]
MSAGTNAGAVVGAANSYASIFYNNYGADSNFHSFGGSLGVLVELYNNYYMAASDGPSTLAVTAVSEETLTSAGFYQKLGYAFVQEDGAFPVLYDGSTLGTGEYTVTLNFNESKIPSWYGYTAGIANNTVTIRTDGALTIPAEVDYAVSGYQIAGWYTSASPADSDEPVTVIDGAATLYAKWSARDIVVTFEDDLGSVAGTKDVSYGGTVSALDGVTREGYEIVAWYLVLPDGISLDAYPYDFSTVLYRDITLRAIWQSAITADDYKWYTEHTGETNFTISTVNELRAFEKLVNGTHGQATVSGAVRFAGATVTLAADIDLTDIAFSPIGTDTTPFQGTFSGTDTEGVTHQITGLSIDLLDGYQALFGYVSGATIENLRVSGSVGAGSYAAVLVGYAETSTFQSLDVSGTVTGAAGETYIGGAVGYAKDSTFQDVTSDVTVTADSPTTGPLSSGGVVAYVALTQEVTDGITLFDDVHFSGVISMTDNRSSSANYTSNYAAVGGIAGIVSQTATGTTVTVQNATNSGSVTLLNSKLTYATAGGLIGTVSGSSSYPVFGFANCSNEGTITGTAYSYSNNLSSGTAGLCGTVGIGSVADCAAIPKFTNCFNSGNISAVSGYIGGISGYIGGASTNTTNISEFTNCANSGTIECTASATVAIGAVGGIAANVSKMGQLQTATTPARL